MPFPARTANPLATALAAVFAFSLPGAPVAAGSASAWRPVAALAEGSAEPVNALLAAGNVLYAGNDSGVYRSADRGRTWKRSSNRECWALAHDGKRLYLGTMWGMFRSWDAGANWASISGTLSISNIVTAFAFDGGNLFAGIQNQGVVRSRDFGETWAQSDSGMENNIIFSLAATGGKLYAGTPWGVYLSNDAGVSWKLSLKAGRGYTKALVFHHGALFAGTMGGGVFRSPDQGATWLEASYELDDTQVGALYSTGTQLYAGTTMAGVFRFEEKKDIWSPYGTGLPAKSPVGSLAAIGQTVYAGMRDGKVYCLGPDCPGP